MTAISGIELKRPAWQNTVMLALGFWLSGSLVLDLVIMPTLYATGMMSGAGFATAAYAIFWIFNRIELLCAALVLTGLLVLKHNQNTSSQEGRRSVLLSLLLLAIAIIYTYFLTPQMSAMGMQLNLFEPTATPAAMTTMHGSYWILEALKLIGCGTLLGWCYRKFNFN